ncbi:MAG: hypothetical protein J4A00_10770 [Gammaproteobacteria bacterium]|nr:hypothetical protein [Gammaproteobacteria bacterium]
MGRWLVLVVLLGAALLFVIYAARNRAARRAARPRKLPGRSALERLRRDSRYWGVRIELEETGGACEAVTQLLDKELLINHAPELPLPGCSAEVCRCHYVGLAQRRHGERRGEGERRAEIRYEGERADRRGGDRRTHSDTWDRMKQRF